MAFLGAIPEILNGLEDGAAAIGPLISAWSGLQSHVNSNYEQLQSLGNQRAMQVIANNHATELQQGSLTSAENINQAKLNNALTMQQKQFDQQDTLNTSQQNFQKTMQESLFSNQKEMQSSLFGHSQTMQSNLFENQQNLMQSQFKNNMISGVTSSLFNLAGNAVGSGLSYLTTSALIKQQAAAQRENFDYMTNKASTAYQDAGLPGWLAYGGSGMSQLPRQTQNVNGSNVYTSSLPGNQSSIIWTGSSSQLAFGAGDLPSAQ